MLVNLHLKNCGVFKDKFMHQFHMTMQSSFDVLIQVFLAVLMFIQSFAKTPSWLCYVAFATIVTWDFIHHRWLIFNWNCILRRANEIHKFICWFSNNFDVMFFENKSILLLSVQSMVRYKLYQIFQNYYYIVIHHHYLINFISTSQNHGITRECYLK